ncbi:MAG: response regulator [Rhodoferax sp.]|nr:response regulator [Rhodoferax sp.]
MPIVEERSFFRLDKDKTYLVVDDFDTMRRVTVNQLRLLGAENILTANDGKQALRVLHSQHVDMVLSDWNMPVMTGIELLKAVRADERLFTLPFVMITAEAERQHVERAVASGVSAMLLKPYSPNQLGHRLERAVAAKHRRVTSGAETDGAATNDLATKTAAPARSALASEGRMTVLVVDDTPDNLTLLGHVLKDEYRVRLASSGAKALEICCSDDPPDLVLLDVMMPEMDGYEVARRMREHPNSEATPVIFVTAMTSDDARAKGMELGAVDYITKPIDADLLKPRVRNFMRYVQLRKAMQADFDSIVETALLRDQVEHITRHDIKGPLAGALGLLQGMVADENTTRRQGEQLSLIEETLMTVMNIVNLSSELLKMETGTFQLRAVPVDLAALLRRVAELNRKAWASKDLSISVDVDVPVGTELPWASGDATLCYSLFQNLVKNACEAAPEGSKITITLFDEEPLRIVVRNTGAVPAPIRERFFDKYVTSGKQGGSGLGTYSAKLLSVAQKGEVSLTVDDAANVTSITVRLPRGEYPSSA